MTYRTWLTNSINETAPNLLGGTVGLSKGCDWYESQIDLMSEVNVYGFRAFSSNGFDTGIDNMQYAIFHIKPQLINSGNSRTRFAYWLKDVTNSKSFARVANSGSSHYAIASSTQFGVRPRFLIG